MITLSTLRLGGQKYEIVIIVIAVTPIYSQFSLNPCNRYPQNIRRSDYSIRTLMLRKFYRSDNLPDKPPENHNSHIFRR